MSADIETHFLPSKGGKPAVGIVGFGKESVLLKAHVDGTFMLTHDFEVPMERSEITDLGQFLASAATSSVHDHYVRWSRVCSQGEDWFFTVWRARLHVCVNFNSFTAGYCALTLPPEVATRVSETIEALLIAELTPPKQLPELAGKPPTINPRV